MDRLDALVKQWKEGKRDTEQLELILDALPNEKEENRSAYGPPETPIADEVMGEIAEEGYDSAAASPEWNAYAEDIGSDFLGSTSDGDILALGGYNGTDYVIISKDEAEERGKEILREQLED